MAHHKSSKKRIRQDARKRITNRYYKKSTRTFISNLREIEEKEKAMEFLPKVVSMIDRLVKKNLWHKNKGANLKSKLYHHINALS
jgi:small subunit ribosomal protein S20